MRALILLYQCWALILYCCSVPNSEKQWLSSLKPIIDPLFVPNDIPWLVTMPDTCQGVILSQWWILSTANCLTKLKHFQSDTAGIVNQEDILLGYNICLHSSFDPQVQTNPFQGDIGLVLLQSPIRSEEIPFFHTYNIFRKRCYNCQYRHCRVYQYQNHDKFATNIKKLSVKLLDLSFCHHQHIHVTKSNILCIWIQPQEDCWVQQGSPVLCFFGNHWEIVGLVSEPSVACYDPIVVVKTAPYQYWMRWLIKASQKPSDPIFSLPCSFFPGVKSGTQDRLSLNRIPAILTSHGLSIQPWKGRLGIFPLVRQHRNPPPLFFGSNNRETFPGSTQLYLQNSQISSSDKSPWTTLVARLWDTLDITEPWSSSGTGSFEPLVLSDPRKFSSADIPIPWEFPRKDVIKYQHQTVTESVKPLVGIIGFHTLPLLNVGGSWILFSTDIDAPQLHSEIKTAQSQITRFNYLPFHSQLPAKPWLEITPNVGSWIHFMPDKTMMHMQSSEESVRTQTYDANERVNTIVKPVTYSLHSGEPSIANKIEFWTHFTLNAEGLQYPTSAHTLETWFQLILNTIGAQGSIKRTKEYWILPESMSTQFLTSSALYVSFTWVPPTYNSISSWAQYKVSMMRPSNQMESITSLSKHKTFLLKPQMQTEYVPWLLINTVKPFIHSKFDTVEPWIQSETEIFRPLTQSDTGSKQQWSNPEASTFRGWKQSKLNLVMPFTRPDVDTVRLWLQRQTDTISTWSQPESQKIISWSGSETDSIKSWYHSQMDTFKPWVETELQRANSWSQFEGDIARAWAKSEANNVKLWFQKQMETVTLLTELIIQTAYHWIQSETEMVRPWSQSASDKVRAWIQHAVYTIRPTWDEYGGDKYRLWTPTLEAVTIRHSVQSDGSIIIPSVQNEDGILISYTQNESPEVNAWTPIETERTTLLTQDEKIGVKHWSEILTETVTTWAESQFSELNSSKLSVSDIVTLWTQTESPLLNLWLQPVADTFVPGVKAIPSEMNPWSKTIPNTVTTWNQAESIAVNTWSQSENDIVIPWPQPEYVAINPWTQSIDDTVTQWMQEESADVIPWTKIVSDQVLPWTQTETLVNNWLQSEMDILSQTSLSLGPLATEILWIESLFGIVTQWSQADSLVINSQTQILTDTVILCIQAETPSFHSRTMSETDTVTTWTLVEWLVVSSLKRCETESIPSWVKKGYPKLNLWTQPETDMVTLWAQVETPEINSFTQLVVDMVPPWTQSEFSVVNLWTQYVVDLDTLWTQTGSPAVIPWRKPVSDSGVRWTQNEQEATSQWTQTGSDKVTSFAQAEFPIVESLTNTVTDIVTLWTEVEYSAVNPWTEAIYPSVTPWTTLETDILWTHTNSDIINLFTQTIFHTLILWTQGVMLNTWAQFETDTVIPWTQPESPATNFWAWSKTNPVTSWAGNRYPALNPWTQTEANKLAPWSQPESGSINSWINLENDIVITFIQGESQVLNNSPMVVAGTMRAWTQVDSPVVNPGIQADNDKVTLWTKSESLAIYYLPIYVTDTVTVWNMAAIISVKSWPHTITKTDTQWIQNESPLVYPLIQSRINSVTLITHTIILAISPRMSLGAFAATSWTQAESPKENGWTVSETAIPWTMEFSPIVKYLMETLSNTNITRIKSKFSEIKLWTSPGERIVPLWTQAESPTVNAWTQSQVHIVTKWTHIDPPTNILTQAKFVEINMWTQSELSTINGFIESKLPAIYPSMQIEGSTVTSSTRSEFLAMNPWTEIIDTTVTLWIQAEYPLVNPWTVSDNDTATLGIVVETPSSFLIKSEQHRRPLWTQTESQRNRMMQDIANIFTKWTKTESLPLNPWTNNIANTFTVQTLDKSPTENYWTDTLASTLWIHYESQALNPWIQTVTFTFAQWNQAESPTVNPQEETIVLTYAPWIQFEYPRVNSQPGNTVSTMAWLNQDKSLIAISCTETGITRVLLQIQESTVVNPCPQTLASVITPLHTEIPWSDISDATVTTWTRTESLADEVASIVTIWTQDESPAVNPRTYTLVSTVAPWNKVKYVTINYWTLTSSSTVIPWIQTEFRALKIWTQTLFFSILPWTQDEFPANTLTDTVVTTVRPWTYTVSPKIKTWTETLASAFSPWIHSMSLRVETWTKTISTVTSWTQSLFSAYPLRVTLSSTVTCWTHSESPGVNSCTENVIKRVIFWTLLKTESKKEWTLPETSIFTILLHPPTDTTESLVQIKKPLSLLGMHPEISNIQKLPISEMFISWIVPFTRAAILLPKPEDDDSRYWFKTQTKRMKHWTQSEYQTVNTLTQSSAERVDSITQYETDPLTSWTQTKTRITNPWSQFKRNTIRISFFSDSDVVRQLIQTDPGILTPWIHYRSSIVTSWTKVDSNAVNLQTQTEVNTVTQLTQADMSSVKHLTMTVINNTIPWFQNQLDTIRPGTQLESQIIASWIRLEEQFAHSWVQPEAKAIRSLTYFELHETQPWPTPESQVFSTLTEVDTVTSWAPTQNVAIGPWSQTENQMTCSVIPNEVGKINPHIQPETSLITFWTDIQSGKVQPCIPFESAITRPWSQYETVEISPSIHLDADAALRPWLQTQMDLTLSVSDTLISCLQTQGATTRPWIQQSVSLWTQTEVGIILSCTQQRALTDPPWIHPETQEMKSWIKLEANKAKSWLHLQRNKAGPWAYSESQVVSVPVQSEEGVIHPMIHPEFQADQSWTHPEIDFIASGVLPKSDNVSVRIKPEIQIRNSTDYKGDIITLFASLEFEPDRETPLTSHFGSWSKSVSKETVSLPDEYFTTLSMEISTTESQPKISYFHPSEFTNNFFLTLPSPWLPERVDYLNHGSELQITKTKGSFYMSNTSLSHLSPSLSFLTPFSLQSLYILSPSCSIFSCTFSSSGISESCSIHSSIVFFSPVLLPLASFVSSIQELNSSKFSEDTIISYTGSSLFAAPVTLLTKNPSLIHVSQYEINSNHHEQDPLKYSEFNVSMAECHLGVVWKESFQAFWLFKTAIISHETTECGLRPGLIPHCPNCWEAEVGEFPWMVSIQLSFSHFCAGSILNEQWILTTARCANFIKNSEALALVQVGLIDLQDSSQAQTVGIHRAMPYLGPKGPLGPGLLFLKQPLHFQPLVLPICLVERMEQDKNIQLYDCWLPSWSLMRGSPGILQKRHLSILQVSTCAQFWPKLNEFTFCVEAKKAMGEAGCKGDLGAPLVCHLQQKDTWVQVGILSHFDEHCTKPYVFSKVSPFLFWLQGVTRPSHAPWSLQGPMTTSASISLSVSASTNASAFTSTPASIRPHFISLPQPQTLADRISLRYTMPWQVMIISCGNQICSGSIVSRSWVLTAAHCVRHMNPEDTAVILGLRQSGTPLRVVKVSTILLHERFRLVSGTARNDLALLLLQELQTPIQILAPLGNLKNLNTSECWLAGPRILKQGETDENPEVLQMQVMGASSCAHLYPDIGSSIVCFVTQAKSSNNNVETVIPGSAVMCRPMSGNGSWRQIGLTSLKALATIVSPHFSWILSTSAKAGHALNQAVIPWLDKPKSSSSHTQSTTLLLLSIIVIAVSCDLMVIAK